MSHILTFFVIVKLGSGLGEGVTAVPMEYFTAAHVFTPNSTLHLPGHVICAGRQIGDALFLSISWERSVCPLTSTYAACCESPPFSTQCRSTQPGQLGSKYSAFLALDKRLRDVYPGGLLCPTQRRQGCHGCTAPSADIYFERLAVFCRITPLVQRRLVPALTPRYSWILGLSKLYARLPHDYDLIDNVRVKW